MGKISKTEFLREYTEALELGDAAAFVGAGFSVGAGFFDWKELLREVAKDLGLDIDEEHDLLAVAQYEVNRKKSRSSLDTKIVRAFGEKAHLTENHAILARLPIDTLWTTNYDTLVEQAFKSANKSLAVRHDVADLRARPLYSDATLFKMHGDVGTPSRAVLTKDDYEKFEVERAAFTTQLKADLLSKRFVFLGFSFTDPNILYTFNRLRRILDPTSTSLPDHYCILRQPQRPDSCNQDGQEGEFARARFGRQTQRFEYQVDDLGRFGVQVLVIDSYEEITDLLKVLERRVSGRSILISGAAHDFDPWGRTQVETFCKDLGKRLIEEGYNIVSGFGLGISGAVILGAHEAVMRQDRGRLPKRLRLFPFPFDQPPGVKRDEFYRTNRRSMIQESGVAIFICGNKLDGKKLVSSGGMREEYQMAREAGHICLPVGRSGHVAREIWQELEKDQTSAFPGIDVGSELSLLGSDDATVEQLLDAIFSILEKVRSSSST